MSRSRLFRTEPSLIYLKGLIERTCISDEHGYVLNKDCFKRAKLLDMLSSIQTELLEFYVLSKQSYVNNMSTYSGFSNVLRQLCRHHNVMMKGQIVYDHSTYQTEYRIYIH